MLRCKKSDVVKLFKALGYPNPEKWSDEKLKTKIEHLPEVADDDDTPELKGAQGKLLDELVEAVEDDHEIDLTVEEGDEQTDEPDEAPKKKRGRPPKARAPSTDDDDGDDPDADEDPEPDEEAADDDPDEDSEPDADDPETDEADADEPADDDTDPNDQATDPILYDGTGRPIGAQIGTVNQTEIEQRFAQAFPGMAALLVRFVAAVELLAAALAGQTERTRTTPAAVRASGNGQGAGLQVTPARKAGKSASLKDVVAEIKRIMKAANEPKKGRTKKQIVAQLQETFPSRDAKWLSKKLEIQLGGRLKAQGVAIKNSGDRFYSVGKSK